MKPSLITIRRELEGIDRAIVLLIAARIEVASEAIRIRVQQNGKVTDPAQEQRVITRARHWAVQTRLSPTLVETVFRAVVGAGKDRFTESGKASKTRSLPAVSIEELRVHERARGRPHSVAPIGPAVSVATESTG